MSPTSTPAISNTSIAPLFSVFAATISGPMPKLDQTSSAIFNIDDAGPMTLSAEIEDEEWGDQALWED